MNRLNAKKRVFGEAPNTAGGSPALPEPNEMRNAAARGAHAAGVPDAAARRVHFPQSSGRRERRGLSRAWRAFVSVGGLPTEARGPRALPEPNESGNAAASALSPVGTERWGFSNR